MLYGTGMRKNLLQFALFLLSLFLLLVAGSFIHAGHANWAVAIFVLMAGYFLWQMTRTKASSPSLDEGTGTESRRPKPHALDFLFLGLWLAGLIVVSGVFGNHPTIFNALGVIAIAIVVVRVVSRRKKAN